MRPYNVYKNTRGELWGWTLSPRDAEHARNCTSSEMILKNFRRCCTCAFPKQRGEPVLLWNPVLNVNWSLDGKGTVPIVRRGFTLAVDLAGTAHAFMGSTWIDPASCGHGVTVAAAIVRQSAAGLHDRFACFAHSRNARSAAVFSCAVFARRLAGAQTVGAV